MVSSEYDLHLGGTDLVPDSYDALAAIALVRAAEKAKSPAILQLFPITMRKSLTQSIHADVLTNWFESRLGR